MRKSRGTAQALQGPVGTNDALTEWVRQVVGVRVPTRAVCPGHLPPIEYLARAHFEPARDLVVWAPRGGGKTRLGAVATLMDLIRKPGCQVRILGGSLDQSLKMWEHLEADLLRLLEAKTLTGHARSRRIELANGSTVAVLTQSQRAVRGLRVQKLRCDEVELFDPRVWEAAQLVTRSNPGHPAIAGTIEAFSTLHRPFGLMHRIVEQAQTSNVSVIKWCLMEVLERCSADRPCAGCALHDDCGGRAKVYCDGFFAIDDAIAMKRRVSRRTWDAEMMCRRPAVDSAVFPDFDPALHVVQRPQLPAELWLGIDFGFASPFVCLWIESGADGVTHVIDEYVQPQRMIEEHIETIRARPWGQARLVACDPAGQSRSDQTATSNVAVLRRAGFVVKCRRSPIVDGVELIRRALRPATGQPDLFVHPRCQRLIRALQSYRYADGGSELPLKDGEHDHLIDALRYYFVNRQVATIVSGRKY